MSQADGAAFVVVALTAVAAWGCCATPAGCCWKQRPGTWIWKTQGAATSSLSRSRRSASPCVEVTARGILARDLFAGYPQHVQDVGGKSCVQQPEKRVLGTQHAVLGARRSGGWLHADGQARHHRQVPGGGAPWNRQGQAGLTAWMRSTVPALSRSASTIWNPAAWTKGSWRRVKCSPAARIVTRSASHWAA